MDSKPKTYISESEKSRKLSIIDSSAYQGMFDLMDNYITPFALLLGAGNFTVGLLKSLPQLLNAITQPLTLWLSQFFHGRKEYVLKTVQAQIIFLFLMLGVAFFPIAYREAILLVVFCLYAIMGPFGNAVWASWIADIVPEKIRGEFFGKMKRNSGAVSFISVLVAGLFLNVLPVQTALYGFIAIFGLAIVFRLISYRALKKMHEPQKANEMRSLEIRMFLKESKEKGFWPVLVLALIINFGTYVAAPFFAVYMIRDLQFDYLTFGILSSTMIMARFASTSYWGKIADRLGNKMIMAVTGILIVTTPLLWLFSGSPYYLFFVQIFAGFCWAGFDLAVLNYVINFGSRLNRTTQYMANYNVFNGMALFLGGIAGGAMLSLSGFSFLLWSGIPAIFALSGAIRLLGCLICIPVILKSKAVSLAEAKNIFVEVAMVMPLRGMSYGVQGVVLAGSKRAIKLGEAIGKLKIKKK